MLHVLLKNKLLIRLLIFCISFIILSGWYGPWIIGTKLLYSFYFFVYGNLGKVLLFSVLALAIVIGKRYKEIKVPNYDKHAFVFLLIAWILAPLFFPIASLLLLEISFTSNLPLSILAHSFIIVIPFLLALGIFGIKFWINFLNIFKKEIYLCAGLALFFYFMIFYIWTFWPYFSDIVLRSVQFLFSLSFDNVVVFEPRTLFVESFAVTIDQACSGLESFLLFTGLCSLIAYVDRRKINWKKFIMFYLFGILGTFLVNILRVYGIIWAGLIFSPQIAAELFHTYLGMIFFLLYFVFIVKYFYKYVINEKNKNI